MKRKIFGTDGVRGLANQWPMTPEIALQLGQAIAVVFRQSGRHQKIIIGKDTRLSGYMIEQALAAGICSMGADVYLCGPLPTPGIAFLTASMRADAGVVVSASHNAFDDNGIKLFCRHGFKLPDDLEAKIESIIFNQEIDSKRAFGKQVGKAHRIDDSIGRYVVFLKNTFPNELTLDGIKIAVDCAHGAAYKVAPAVFEELGAQVTALGVRPNGENINRECGSLYPEALQKRVVEARADLGIALDGDADRIIFVDEKGSIVHGDRILYALAVAWKKAGTLKKNTLVSTVMANFGLEAGLNKQKIELVRAPVGDRYVVDEMRKIGANLGGEPSGHIIFLDHATTGDGIIAALQIQAEMIKQKKTLSELVGELDIYPQELVNVRVREKPEISSLKEVQKSIDHAKAALKKFGQVLVRYSGTEPVARVMVEGADATQVKQIAEDIAERLKKSIGA